MELEGILFIGFMYMMVIGPIIMALIFKLSILFWIAKGLKATAKILQKEGRTKRRPKNSYSISDYQRH